MRKILRRAIALFAIGLLLNWFELATKGDMLCFEHLRIWVVLQRIAICYFILSGLVLNVSHKCILHIAIGILVVYAATLLLGNGYAEDASNIVARVDNAIFGQDHLYRKSPVDPEGLLSTLPAAAHVIIGFYVGMRIKKTDTVGHKAFYTLLIAAVLIIVGYLLAFLMPPNKRIWSPSYVLLTCGLAAAAFGILIYTLDMRKTQCWYTFFHVFGINPIAIYAFSEILSVVFKRTGANEAVFDPIKFLVPHQQTASLVYALVFLLLNYCVGYLLYKKKIFLKL
jgi:predicted acyltransferase